MPPKPYYFPFLPKTPQTPTIKPPLIRSFTATTFTTPTNLSLYLQRSKLIDSLRRRLVSHNPSSPFPLPSSPLLDSFVASRILLSASSPESALSLFRSLQSLPSFSSFPHPSLLPSLSRRLPNLLSLFPSLPLPPLHRLRLLAASGDLPAALQTFSSLRSDPNSRRRRPHRSHPSTEAYNLIIGLHAAADDHSSAVSTFSLLLADGAIPNSRTYTVIIDHLLRANSLNAALEIFNLLPTMRIRRTSKQYNLLAAAFSSSGQFDRLLELVEEMNSDGILPGRAMLVAIAALRAAGFVDQTEEFAGELSPDRRIGYAVDEGDECEEEDDDDESINNLKRWIDPAALARALDGWDPADVALLESAGFIWTTRLVCKMLRSFRSPKTAWEFFCWVAYQPGGGFTHDRHTVSRMISILARDGHAALVDRLLAKLQSDKILLPFATTRLIIDFFGISKNADAATRLYRSAPSICGPLSRLNLMLLSSSLLRTVAKSGKGRDAIGLLEEMTMAGIVLDIQTFSGLIEYFAGEGDLKSVHKVFGMGKQCRLKLDAFVYGVVIRAYCKQERAVVALRVFDEMLSSGLVGSEGTKGILVRSLWKEGKLREAAMVEERCEEVGELPAAEVGHGWTVSAADFERVRDVYIAGVLERNGV